MEELAVLRTMTNEALWQIILILGMLFRAPAAVTLIFQQSPDDG